MAGTPTIVMATRNRRARVLATLSKLERLPERPPIVLVDNGSDDGTPAAVRRRHPAVRVLACSNVAGAASRTVGVEAADTSLVAFSDDDSWWEPGALRRAADVFSRYPRLGLLAARVLVEPAGVLDPTCREMGDSPLEPATPLPGPPVLGFLACGAVARRDAVLACGGFHSRYGFGGEEELLAIDMASAGWGLAYVDGVVAHHEPAPGRRKWTGTNELRNRLWSTWLRRSLPEAVRFTLAAAGRDGAARSLLAALRGVPWVLRERRVAPAHVRVWLRALDEHD